MTSIRHHAALRTAEPRSRLTLRRLARSDRPLVVGPWLSEVGFEVLYWLPFLAWVAEEHGIERERVIAVTRGGAGCWYGDLAGRTLDVLDVAEPDDLRRWSGERLASRSTQKQFAPGDTDREILRRVLSGAGLELEDVDVLHPGTMYSLFAPFWDGWRPIERVRSRTVNRPIHVDGAGAAGLAPGYVAAKFNVSDCFPASDENREFVARLVGELAERHDVVLLSTGLRLDDHADFELPRLPRVHTLEQRMTPADNLAVQTRAIAGARTLLGTYGGFSYLGPYLGVDSLAYYSEENFVPSHLDVMRHARADLERAGGPVAFDVRLPEPVAAR